jgi:hypothetical protein
MHVLRLAFTPRFVVYTLSILLTCAVLLTVIAYPPAFHLALVPLAILITMEIPRLCRGGSRSLTFRAVATAETSNREPPRTRKEASRWTSTRA